MRIFPRSLLGQVMLVLGIGLIAGQAISAALLYRAAEQRREAALVHSLSLHIVASERREFAQQRRESRRRQMERMRARFAEERVQAEIDRRGLTVGGQAAVNQCSFVFVRDLIIEVERAVVA